MKTHPHPYIKLADKLAKESEVQLLMLPCGALDSCGLPSNEYMQMRALHANSAYVDCKVGVGWM
ncbi:MAG: hypothetical protein K9J28_05045 [Sulfuritalea sp.]|nr:hypothetical protein [Sulfuritalea sp.]